MGLRNLKGQSASEFLLTYGWAFLLTAIAVIALYTFIAAPQAIGGGGATTCTTNSGPHCMDVLVGANAFAIQVAMLLVNEQPYPVYNPTLYMNASWVGTFTQICQPQITLPGGTILCNAVLTRSPPVNGMLLNSPFTLSYIPCPSANSVTCSTGTPQSFTGQFSTHLGAGIANTIATVNVIAQNATQSSTGSALDRITAIVDILGFPVTGATVSFSTNTANAIITPTITSSDATGNAVAYVTSSYPGCVLITGNYASINANTVVTFT
ncbi:MAG: Ig-like domain-containing protein [Candidatus Micrarchaeota archaeon]|nr:Ig-like domain-containing protein [Candidatus Micrarchaeota archaeon]MDE1804394.1 Ig-like domain-containing protein [Candidatus Micrarchaeota archaeon]MDE1846758.1 Ig-like domain-containing protein [Candidatus Micrarchaeota archaeon]